MTPAAVDLQILRAFVTVGREGSVSRAAERLHRSQPAVSLQLKRLADETGLQLFHRDAHGLRLTADGHALIGYADRVLAGVAEYAMAIDRLRGTVHGRLRIGTILDPEFTRLGAFLSRLLEAAPQISTELSQGMSGDVLEKVLRGDLDVGFHVAADLASTEALSPRLAVRTLHRFDYLVVAPAGWEAKVRGCGWQGLADLPWLGTPARSVHSRLLATVFAPLKLEPHYTAQVDQEASMLDLLKSGLGLSLMRDTVAFEQSSAHGVVIVHDARLHCELQFVSLLSRREESIVSASWDALDHAWSSVPSLAGGPE